MVCPLKFYILYFSEWYPCPMSYASKTESPSFLSPFPSPLANLISGALGTQRGKTHRPCHHRQVGHRQAKRLSPIWWRHINKGSGNPEGRPASLRQDMMERSTGKRNSVRRQGVCIRGTDRTWESVISNRVPSNPQHLVFTLLCHPLPLSVGGTCGF